MDSNNSMNMYVFLIKFMKLVETKFCMGCFRSQCSGVKLGGRRWLKPKKRFKKKPEDYNFFFHV